MKSLNSVKRKITCPVYLLHPTSKQLALASPHLFQFAYDECEQKPEERGHHTGTSEHGELQK